MLEQWSLILFWDYQPVTISDDLWLAVFFFNSTNTLLREGLNSVYSCAPQFQTPSASTLHTLRNKHSSSSFRKGSTRLALPTRPTWHLKLRTAQQPPTLSLPYVFPQLTLPPQQAQQGANSLRSGNQGSPPPHPGPPAPWSPPLSTATRLPYISQGTVGSDPHSRPIC